MIEFILDALVIDEMHTGTLKLSLQHLLARMQDRILLQQYFKFTGGRYLPTPIQGQIAPTLSTNQSLIGSGDSPLLSASGDIELRHFKTSLPSIEMSRTLLVNIEKDFSDKRYDLRLYEVTVKHQPHQKKYSFEMYPVESQDTVLFRFDFLSQALLPGKKLMIERFNIIQ